MLKLPCTWCINLFLNPLFEGSFEIVPTCLSCMRLFGEKLCVQLALFRSTDALHERLLLRASSEGNEKKRKEKKNEHEPPR